MCVCTVEDGKVRHCSLHGAAEDYLGRLLDSQNENARLQERVEEAIERGAWLFRLARVWRINIRGLRGMRDIVADATEAAIESLTKRAEAAEALAERRKEALEPFAALLQPHIERTAYEGDATGVLALNDVKITVGDLRRARAAIEE